MTETGLDPHDTESIKTKHMSPDDLSGLGRWAVELRIDAGEHRLNDEDHIAAVLEPFRQKSLSETRKTLAGLADVDRKIINHLMTDQGASAWIDQSIGFDKAHKRINDYVGRLVSKDKSGNYIVSDEVLQNFLEWHNHALAEKQHELDGRSGPLKDDFRQSFEDAVLEGWIPPSTLDHLKRLDSTLLIVDDGFKTLIKGARATAQSLRNEDKHIIRLSPLHLKDPQKLLLHEFTHIMEGQDAVRPDENEVHQRKTSSGMYRIFGDSDGAEAINEAVTEHLADSMANGKLDRTGPDSRVRKGALYGSARELLDVLVNRGVQKINIRDFMAADFEDGEQAQELDKDSAQQRLVDQLHQAFPFTDVIQEIAMFEGEAKNLREYAEKLRQRARLHKIKVGLGIRSSYNYSK